LTRWMRPQVERRAPGRQPSAAASICWGISGWHPVGRDGRGMRRVGRPQPRCRPVIRPETTRRRPASSQLAANVG
jgi:hypothetical protein